MSVTDVDTPDAILTDLMNAVRHTGWSKPLWARQKPPSDAAILGHTDVNYRPSSWSRAKERGQLPPEVFKRIAALIDGPVVKRDLEERWYALTDKWPNKILGDDVTLERLVHIDVLDRKYKYPAKHLGWIRLAAVLLERYGLDANLIRFSQPDLENLYARIRRERGEIAGLVSAFILTNAVFASFKDGRVLSPEPFIAMSCCLINVASVTRNQRMLLHAASLLSGEESVFANWQHADALANFHQKRLATNPVGEMEEVTRRFGLAHDAATRIISERLVSPFPALNNAISGTVFNFANTKLRHVRSTLSFDAIIERTTSELEADGKRLGQQRAKFTLGSGEMYSCELFIRHHNAGGLRRCGFTEHDPGLARAEVDKVFEIHGFDHVPLYVRVSLLECRSKSTCLEGDLAGFEENARLLKADLDLLGDIHRSERMRSVMEAQHRSLTQARHSKRLRSDTTLGGAVAAF